MKNKIEKYMVTRKINADNNKEEIIRFFKTLKDNNHYTIIWSKKIDENDGEYNSQLTIKNRRYKKVNEDFNHLSNTMATFFSINSFNTQADRNYVWHNGKNNSFKNIQRNKECLHSFDTVVFDFDHIEIDDETFMNKIYNIKVPTFIIKSGHGYHVYYKLTNGYLTDCNTEKLEKKIRDYKNVCKVLHQQFVNNGLNPDPMVTGDVCRVMRVPTSYNVKDINNPIQTQIIFSMDISYDFVQLIKECKQLNKKLKVYEEEEKEDETTETKITRKQINNESCVLPSYITVPNTNYPRRYTQKTNYNIFLNQVLRDICWLTTNKDYTGQRQNLLFFTASLINSHNIHTNFDQIDLSTYVNLIGNNMGLDKEEIDNILKQMEKNDNYIVATRETLYKKFGLNNIDETYMEAIVITEQELNRRKEIRIKENNKKNNQKYNKTNNQKRSEKNKLNKVEKQRMEEDLVEPLMNNNSLRSIAQQTGFSVNKVQNIINRIKNR